jgi:hypothetical protein
MSYCVAKKKKEKKEAWMGFKPRERAWKKERKCH